MPGDRLTASGLKHDFLQNRYMPATSRAEMPAILSASARAGVMKKQVLIVPARVESLPGGGFECENIMRKLLVLLSLFCPWSAHAADSNKTIRRLRVEDYPELPSGVAAVLRSRRCTMPQPNKDGPARNVIEGEFFHKGQKGWAVLCSSAGKSSILVFRNNYDRSPDEIAESPDQQFLINTWQGGTVYSREISAVGQEFILRHHRAYSGPKPPPVDHNGIDDAFLEKASVTWYWHRGKWMQLPGAD
jgi:hypothetical protein